MLHKGLCFKVAELDATGMFFGHGAIFGNVDNGGDIIMPGAFKKSLQTARQAKRLPRMLLHHDTTQIPGVWTEIEEDSKGLALVGQLLMETPLGQATYHQIKAGALDGLSIGYEVPAGGAVHNDRLKARELRELKLWEVSVVAFPMNASARVERVKSRAQGYSSQIALRRVRLARERLRW